MASGECEVISDCVNEAGVFHVCYQEASFSNKTFFCDCSNWFGWTGEGCDEESTQLQYYRASLIIIALWAIIIGFFNVFILHYHVVAKRKKRTPFNPAFYTGLLVLLACFSLSMNALIQLPAAYDSSRFEIETYSDLVGNSFEDLAVKWGRISVYFQVFASVFFFFASIQIVNSWSNIIFTISRIFPDLFYFREATLRKITKSFLIVFSLALIVSLSLDAIAIWSAVVSVAAFVATVTYLMGYNRFITCLKMLSQSKDEAKGAIRTVRISVQVNTVCLTFNSIFFAAFYATFLNFRETLAIGELNHVLLLRDLATITTLIMFSFNSWYLHKITRKVLKLEKPDPSSKPSGLIQSTTAKSNQETNTRSGNVEPTTLGIAL